MKRLVLICCFVLSYCSYANFWSELSSPVTTPARTYFLTGAAITLTAAILEDQIVDPLQEDTVEDKPLGKYSYLGDYAGQMIPNALYIISMYIAGESKYAKHMLKATLYSGFVTTLLKYSIREPRPNSHNRESFPSGHTTSAFAFASTVGIEHGWFWGTLAYMMAGGVAYSRINDNAHYLHDVLGGATIGLAYGLGIYYEEKRIFSDNDGFFVSAVPALDFSGGYLVLMKTF